MTQAEIENHIEIAEHFLQNAEEQFESGDLPQASDKAWGAVAHYLKSVAQSRGWRDGSHRDTSDIAVDLAQETDDSARAEAAMTTQAVIEFRYGAHATNA